MKKKFLLVWIVFAAFVAGYFAGSTVAINLCGDPELNEKQNGNPKGGADSEQPMYENVTGKYLT